MMQNILRRLRAAVAVGVLVPATFMAVSVALPGVAQARCVGSTPVTSTLVVLGTTYVSETPVSGACNGNNLYHATARSFFAGWRASVWIQNGGLWTRHSGSFTTTAFSYSYTDDNSHSLMVLCLDDGVSTSFCGWGIHSVVTVGGPPVGWDYTFYGVNSGF
jgi:hypothetical protein